jgi:hypothetical protein
MSSHGVVGFASRRKLVVMLTLLACTAMPLAAYGAPSPEEKADKAKAQAAVSQAVLAYQLAIQGQQTKSPILMLAACETIGMLKTKTRDAGVQREATGTKSTAKAPISLDVLDWQEKAREFAKADKQLLALVDNRIEQMNSRGIINPPSGAYSKYFGSTRYLVLDSGYLPNGGSIRLRNIRVTAREFACVGVVGDVDSDLAFTASDEATGEEQGANTFRGFAIYSFVPKRSGSLSIRVSNNGGGCPYVIIGH